MATPPPITPKQAQQIFDLAVEQNGQNPAALYEMGVSAHQVGRSDIAADLFARSITLDASNADAWAGLGIALRALENLPKAAEAYQRALLLQPDNAEAHNNLGNILLAVGKREDALACYSEALRHRPNYPEAHYNTGNLLHQTGNGEDAARHLRACLEYDPADSLDAALLLARIGFGETPARASLTHMKQLYRSRSETWDNAGDYRADELVARRLKELARGTPLTILDIGCGTGRVGTLVAPLSSLLHGVDLSPDMLTKARQKGVYAELYQDDLVAFLNSSGRQYDALVSAATLIHFGDLRPAFEAALDSLNDKGWFVFTLLSKDDVAGVGGFSPAASLNLVRGGCYEHTPGYVAAAAETAGFSVVSIASETQEFEARESNRVPIAALVVTLQRHARDVQRPQ